MSVALAQQVKGLAAGAVTARGRFRLAIPGGSVVTLLAQGLKEAGIDAANWDVFWVDERCVPATDPESNFNHAKRELFDQLNIPPHGIHAADGGREPEAAAVAYEADLAHMFSDDKDELPRFDLILLGMGEDGHVASLFPGNPALAEMQRRVVPVWNAPKPPPERITLTLPVINHARHLQVVVAGEGKAAALTQVLAADISGPALPAQLLCPSDGTLGWMLDRAASVNLPEALRTPHPVAEEHP